METVTVTTPIGRILYGDCWKPSEKDAAGNQLTTKNGPNAGKPRKEWVIGLAIEKTRADWPAVEAAIKQVAAQSFPTLPAAQGAIGGPGFAWKVVDGDSAIPNTRGVAPNTRDGYPGHYILNLKGGFAPDCYAKGGNPRLTDPSSIRRGYYVRVNISISGNGDAMRPGVYLNPNAVEFQAYGEEISTGPDPRTVFGQDAGALPSGASATPVSGTTPPVASAPPVATTPPPAAPVAPVPAFTVPPPTPPAPAAPPAPVAPVAYNVNGTTYTADQLAGFGWTAEQIAAAPRA